MAKLAISVGILAQAVARPALAVNGGSTMSAPPRFKLSYHNARGRAELSRLMFLISGIPFEDDRFPIEFHFGAENCVTEEGRQAGWEMIRPEFNAALAAGEFVTGMDMLPILTVDGHDGRPARKIGQSMAIERFVARETGMMGADAVESAQIEQVAESARDIKMDLVAAKRKGDEGKSAFFEADRGGLATFLRKLEASLPPLAAEGAGPWLISDKVSYADLCLFALLTRARAGVVEHVPFIDDPDATTAALQGCPRIKAAVEACAALPAVKHYLDSRPETQR